MVPWKPYLWVWLSITTNLIKLIFQNISSKVEQKTMVACYQTCYTNSTESTIHKSIWKNQQPPTVVLHDAKNDKYWIAARHYACYRSNTNNKLTFQSILVFSDGEQSFESCLMDLSAVVLFHFDINSSHAHGWQY